MKTVGKNLPIFEMFHILLLFCHPHVSMLEIPVCSLQDTTTSWELIILQAKNS